MKLRVRLTPIIYLFSIALSLLVMQSCADQTRDFTPVVLVGIDGGDWSTMHPLKKMGKLPVLSRLSKKGNQAKLFSPTMVSPVEWTTMVTGKTEEQHGILRWTKPDKPAKGTQRVTPTKGSEKQFTVITREDRKVKTLWNIFTEHAISSSFFGWWATWPAEKIKGMLLSDTFIYHETLDDYVYPPEEKAAVLELAALSTDEYKNWLNNKGFTDLEDDCGIPDIRYKSGQVKTLYSQIHFDFVKKNCALANFSKNPPEFTGLYLRSSDIASHFFYKEAMLENGETPWSISEANRIRFQEFIPSVYELYDTFIFELLEKFHKETNVIVVSDHGFGVGRYYKKFNFRMFFKRFPFDFKGKKLFQCFTLSQSDDRTAILNLKPVFFEKFSENSESISMLQDLRKALESIETHDSKRLFEEVKIDATRPSSPMHITLTIDKTILLTDELLIKGKVIPAFSFFQYSKFSGFHRPYGIFIASGPSFRKRSVFPGELTTWDVCPLILQLFSLPRARDMRGKAPESLFAEKTLPMIDEIDTYEGALEQEEVPSIDSETNKKILQELRTIGYIE